MSESLEDLRERRFEDAQRFGWLYEDTTAQRGEGYGRKSVLQLKHPSCERLYLFIGPRGGMKTGRSYRSSACKFWEETPLLEEAANTHRHNS